MTITWEQILAFLCEDQTMAITSLLFLAFFAAVALINYALPRVLRPYFLLIASYGFFCYDPVNRPLVWVMAAATLITWLCGLIIGKVRCKPVRILALLASVGFGNTGGDIFERGGKKAPEVDEDTVRDLHAKIGELAVANDFLSRKLKPWTGK